MLHLHLEEGAVMYPAVNHVGVFYIIPGSQTKSG